MSTRHRARNGRDPELPPSDRANRDDVFAELDRLIADENAQIQRRHGRPRGQNRNEFGAQPPASFPSPENAGVDDWQRREGQLISDKSTEATAPVVSEPPTAAGERPETRPAALTTGAGR